MEKCFSDQFFSLPIFDIIEKLMNSIIHKSQHREIEETEKAPNVSFNLIAFIYCLRFSDIRYTKITGKKKLIINRTHFSN